MSTLALLLGGAAVAYEYAGKKCTGSKNCSACKNCKGCKYCKKEGGTCGVCN
ncbi:hypothetical protein [Flavobacterium pygoscelis]|uniref:hypothetical protein n=1 Tax=Flavobacterium pygoscelis TaxID=2893176 RepID=UPI0020BDC08D|nr:hypothetical protein [Flavobacterium pygoscelis]